MKTERDYFIYCGQKISTADWSIAVIQWPNGHTMEERVLESKKEYKSWLKKYNATKTDKSDKVKLVKFVRGTNPLCK